METKQPVNLMEIYQIVKKLIPSLSLIARYEYCEVRINEEIVMSVNGGDQNKIENQIGTFLIGILAGVNYLKE